AGGCVPAPAALPPPPPGGDETPHRQSRQGHALPQRHPRRDRRLRRPDRHLPRRALPPPGPPPRQAQSRDRRRPLRPGHHLPPARRPRSPVLRPWTGLLQQPHQPRTQDRRPRPPAPGPRPDRHPHPRRRRRLTHATIPPTPLTPRTSQGRRRPPTKGEISRSAEGRRFDPAPDHKSTSNLWVSDQAKRFPLLGPAFPVTVAAPSNGKRCAGLAGEAN